MYLDFIQSFLYIVQGDSKIWTEIFRELILELRARQIVYVNICQKTLRFPSICHFVFKKIFF